MSDQLVIATTALRRIADECPKCDGYEVIPVGKNYAGSRCDRCEVAREALRDMRKVAR